MTRRGGSGIGWSYAGPGTCRQPRIVIYYIRRTCISVYARTPVGPCVCGNAKTMSVNAPRSIKFTGHFSRVHFIPFHSSLILFAYFSSFALVPEHYASIFLTLLSRLSIYGRRVFAEVISLLTACMRCISIVHVWFFFLSVFPLHSSAEVFF